MRLPDFLILGTQKAASTWLARRLGEHPDIYVAPDEIHYFNIADNFARGPTWYAGHFEAAGTRLCGEKTPAYLWSTPEDETDGTSMARHVHDLVPEARLVAVLRDPVTRLVSALNHHVRRRRISPLTDPDELLFGTAKAVGQRWRLIETGYYARHLRAYLRHFPRERIKVYFYEDEVKAQPAATVRDCCAFLGVDGGAGSFAFARRDNRSVSSRLGLCVSYYAPVLDRPMGAVERFLPLPPYGPSPAAIERLYEHYRPFNEELFDLLGTRTERWSDRAASGKAA